MIQALKKRILIGLIICVLGLLVSPIYAQENDFSIIPESTSDVGSYVMQVGASGGNVMENYKDIAYGKKNPDGTRAGGEIKDLGGQLASGIMTRDTLLDYVTYIVRFLLQLGLLIGAIVMIYLGYKKITEFRDFKPMGLKYVIMGISILAFAYVIIKTLVSMFIK